MEKDDHEKTPRKDFGRIKIIPYLRKNYTTMSNYKQDKNNFLKKLKDSPYSDELISKWMNTFKDDSICVQFLQAIKLNNEGWEHNKQNGITIEDYNNSVMKHYTELQELPKSLAMTILIGSCDEIAHTFVATEAMKNLGVITFSI